MLRSSETRLGEINFKVDRETFEKASKGEGSREFFYKLCQIASGGRLSRKDLKKLTREEQEKIVFRFLKENKIEEFFEPSKNLFSSLKKAFKKKFNLELEEEWNGKLSDWRRQFEGALKKASTKYLISVGSVELIKELSLEGWFASSFILKEFLKSKEEFKSWILEREEEILESSLKRWKEVEPFRRREKIIRGIVRAYKLGFVELAIYGLFPQCEGVVWDAFLKHNPVEADVESLIRKRNRKFVTIQYATKLILETVTGSEKLPYFLDWVLFVDYKEGTLNRHAIQHGVAVNFGTRENFFKLFLFLDFLAEIINYFIREKKPS